MTKRLWFRAKRYGWGWYPVTKEGWLVMLGYIALFLVGETLFISNLNENRVSQWSVGFLIYIAIITTGLMWICYKTGEKPRWRWGK